MMPKQWKELSTHYDAFFEHPYQYIFEEYDRNISNAQTIKNDILQAIDENNSEKLIKLLSNVFIYKADEKTISNRYEGDHHYKNWKSKYFLVKPVAEALFFEHLSDFKEILEAVRHKDLPFQKAFVETCSKNGIPHEVFECLNPMQAITLGDSIAALHNLDVTHKTATALANDLLKVIENEWIVGTGVDHLIFKLKFLEVLHSKDKDLAKDINFRCIAFNMALILFGFIPNILNLIVTGNFLFLKNTPQQASVACMDSQFKLFQAPEEVKNVEEKCPKNRVSYHIPFSMTEHYI